jgi:hypothetical protein
MLLRRATSTAFWFRSASRQQRFEGNAIAVADFKARCDAAQREIKYVLTLKNL